MLDSPQPSLAGRLAAALESSWEAIARPEQREPLSDWNIWLILSGRGWGKTRTGAELVKSMVMSGRARRVGLIGATASDVRDIMVEGESGLLSIHIDSNRPLYEPSKRRITWPNGAIATAYSAEEADRLRGPQHDFIWMDELASWSNVQATFDMAAFGLRLGRKPRCVITSTPRPIKILKALIARDDVHVTRGKTSDNAANLAPTFLSAIVLRYEGTRLARQELNGEIIEDIEGALWSRDKIDALRVTKAGMPDMRRIVVAVDPAVSVGEDSDETGIIVAGLGDDGHAYIMEDCSGKYSPTEWASKAISAFRRHHADRIVIEKNQGGDMVENTLRMVDPNVPIITVHASRGKITRAEPISALYEQNRVHHAGSFPELEDQMTSFEPGMANSPDRVDALVWGLSDLQVTHGHDGIIEWTRRQIEELRNPIAVTVSSGDLVVMRCPPGLSQLHLIDGTLAEIAPDGTVMVPKDAVGNLRLAGFQEVA